MLKNKRSGMTLIEVMIVVIIMGIIFITSFLIGSHYVEKARYARVWEDFDTLGKAICLYVDAYDGGPMAALDAFKANHTGTTVLNKYMSKPLQKMSTPWGDSQYTFSIEPGIYMVRIICQNKEHNTWDPYAKRDMYETFWFNPKK